jgi:2-polyprenyl-3-methyl-5-hydroxy-6-metoxy-1,4-benzoquinol methylase
MTDPLVDTVGYYNSYAADFAAQTADLDLAPLYQGFLRHMPPGGRILDAGCGVGRDALAFAERGYEVVAFDASEAMVQLARRRVGNRAAVCLKRFHDLNWQNEFDGIWACASLLHVPKPCFTDTALRLTTSLRPRGAWYIHSSWEQGSAQPTGAFLSTIHLRRFMTAWPTCRSIS